MNILCFDLEGLVLDGPRPARGMRALLKRLASEFHVVISTAVPEEEAPQMVRRAGLKVEKVFGNLAWRGGKRYADIAEHFGIAAGEAGAQILAIGHEPCDAPLDLDVLFLWSTLEPKQHAAAVGEAVRNLGSDFNRAWTNGISGGPRFALEKTVIQHKDRNIRTICISSKARP